METGEEIFQKSRVVYPPTKISLSHVVDPQLEKRFQEHPINKTISGIN